MLALTAQPHVHVVHENRARLVAGSAETVYGRRTWEAMQDSVPPSVCVRPPERRRVERPADLRGGLAWVGLERVLRTTYELARRR